MDGSTAAVRLAPCGHLAVVFGAVPLGSCKAPVVPHLYKTNECLMTYQVVLCGRNGVVLAGDGCELSRREFGGVAVVNEVNGFRVASK